MKIKFQKYHNNLKKSMPNWINLILSQIKIEKNNKNGLAILKRHLSNVKNKKEKLKSLFKIYKRNLKMVELRLPIMIAYGQCMHKD